MRNVGLALGLMLVQLAQSLDAWGHVSCTKIDELRTYNSPRSAALIETHYGTKDLFIGALGGAVGNEFYVVRLGPADCGHPTCLHRVVQVASDAVHERFAFYPTGAVVLFTSYSFWFEPLKDVLEPIAFEVAGDSWMVIQLPVRGNVFVVAAQSQPVHPRCGQSANSKSKP